MGRKIVNGVRKFFAVFCLIGVFIYVVMAVIDPAAQEAGITPILWAMAALFVVFAVLLWPKKSKKKQQSVVVSNPPEPAPKRYVDPDEEQYIVLATLDDETCPICGAMDGKIFKMSEYLEGKTAPPFCEDCRCTTSPYYADMADTGERAARDQNGKTIYVPSSMTYALWKKKYGSN